MPKKKLKNRKWNAKEEEPGGRFHLTSLAPMNIEKYFDQQGNIQYQQGGGGEKSNK